MLWGPASVEEWREQCWVEGELSSDAVSVEADPIRSFENECPLRAVPSWGKGWGLCTHRSIVDRIWDAPGGVHGLGWGSSSGRGIAREEVSPDSDGASGWLTTLSTTLSKMKWRKPHLLSTAQKGPSPCACLCPAHLRLSSPPGNLSHPLPGFHLSVGKLLLILQIIVECASSACSCRLRGTSSQQSGEEHGLEPGFESQPCHLLAMQPEANYSNFCNLAFSSIKQVQH